jgi:hypothetical protein
MTPETVIEAMRSLELKDVAAGGLSQSDREMGLVCNSYSFK